MRAPRFERETAAAAPAQTEIVYDLDLREIYCGRLEGVPLEFIQTHYGAFWQANEAQTNDHFYWPGWQELPATQIEGG